MQKLQGQGNFHEDFKGMPKRSCRAELHGCGSCMDHPAQDAGEGLAA